MSAIPTLAALVAAVRTALPDTCPADDAAVAEAIRTARTVKGAVWLATRAWGKGEDDAKAEGREATALACLSRLAAADHPYALAALAAWAAAEAEHDDALAADLTA